MLTTWGGNRRKACVAGLCFAVALPAPLLQGCISPARFARPGTDEAQLTADKHDCATWAPVVKGVVIGAGYGAIAGGAVSANGATDRNAAIVAAVIGIFYGVAIGALSARENVKDYDRCMLGKGYHAI